MIHSKIIEKWRPILNKVGLLNEEDIRILSLFAENTLIIENNYFMSGGTGMGSIKMPSLPPYTINIEGNNCLPMSIKTLKDIIPFIQLNPISEKKYLRTQKINSLLNNSKEKYFKKIIQNITYNKDLDFATNGENLLLKKTISTVILSIIDNIKNIEPMIIDKQEINYKLKSFINNDFAQYLNSNLSIIVNNDSLYDYIDREDEYLLGDSFKYLGKFNYIRVYRNLSENNNECFIINKNSLQEDGLVLTTDRFIKYINWDEKIPNINYDMYFLVNYKIEQRGNNPLNGFKRIIIE